MLRSVTPELLDELSPDDPRAIHSRGDLQRVNALMGNADIMARALLEEGPNAVRPTAGGTRSMYELVELGAGDGTFLLELAKRVGPALTPVHAILVDQQSLLTPQTRAGFEALLWHVESVQSDVFAWLEQRAPEAADITLANLFLHHFPDDRLSVLLRDAARQTSMFVSCEPVRSGMALAAASLTGLIGCNRVTVHDALVSIRAGFRDRELSDIWPRDGRWRLIEHKTGRFTHGFVARRDAAGAGREAPAIQR